MDALCSTIIRYDQSASVLVVLAVGNMLDIQLGLAYQTQTRHLTVDQSPDQLIV